MTTFSLDEIAVELRADPAARYAQTLGMLSAHYAPARPPQEAIELMCEAIEAAKTDLRARIVEGGKATGTPPSIGTLEKFRALLICYDSFATGIRAAGTVTPESLAVLGPEMVDIAGGAIRQPEYAVAALRQVSDFLIGLKAQPAYQP